MKRLVLILLAVGIWSPVFQAQEGPTSRSYRIGPRDEIQIRVEELSDLDTTQTVAEDGTINLPVIGTIDSRGLTESELELRIRARLEEEGLRRATVHVIISAYRSRPVSVLGAVADPGNHFIPGQASLMEVLLNAGGLLPDHGSEILIHRFQNGLAGRVRIPVEELIDAGNPDVNLPIFGGDQINIPLAQELTIHFLGEVANSGTHTFRSKERVTLLTAIARAGGLSETASPKIRILRATEGDKRREIKADYRKILSGRDNDVDLVDGDLVVVKESFF